MCPPEKDAHLDITSCIVTFSNKIHKRESLKYRCYRNFNVSGRIGQENGIDTL